MVRRNLIFLFCLAALFFISSNFAFASDTFGSVVLKVRQGSSFFGLASVATSVAVAVSAIAAISPLIGPGLGAFAYQSLMGILGILPNRKQVWGTVYDSDTKRPIPFAHVQLLDRNKRVLETRIADKAGRYGFLTSPERLQSDNVQIYLVPRQSGFTFPSKAPATVDSFVYGNIYHGDSIEISKDKLINFDIPMDPLKSSSAPLLLKSPSIMLGASVAAMADIGFWLGLIIVPLNFLTRLDPFSFGILCLYLGTASLRVFGITEHPFGIVKDGATGHAMPFALITMNDHLSGKRVGFAVTDELGRYFLVAQKGTYVLEISTPANIIPNRKYTEVINTKRGWITREFKV